MHPGDFCKSIHIVAVVSCVLPLIAVSLRDGFQEAGPSGTGDKPQEIGL